MKPAIEFEPFPKVPRLYRDIVITEKIDGTNAGVYVDGDGNVFASSRKRWITPDDDNYGFARWAQVHADELRNLGPGMHFGEWWGRGIQRNYGLEDRRFSLFNTHRWEAITPDPERPGVLDNNSGACCACVFVVPTLYTGPMSDGEIRFAGFLLEREGSKAAPGFDNPEGVMVYHTHSRSIFKATLDGDGHKG